jgi:hypothetical protein
MHVWSSLAAEDTVGQGYGNTCKKMQKGSQIQREALSYLLLTNSSGQKH